MHYKDGREAQLGDIVRGRGYNLPHEAQGVVVGLTPSASYDNIHVMTMINYQPLGENSPVIPMPYEEHGTCAEFSLLYRQPKMGG